VTTMAPPQTDPNAAFECSPQPPSSRCCDGRSNPPLDVWISDATTSPLGLFVTGIAADRDAAEAGITESGSNGQSEGQITKLQLLRRQMNGRPNLDLLCAYLCPA
jgi:transposase